MLLISCHLSLSMLTSATSPFKNYHEHVLLSHQSRTSGVFFRDQSSLNALLFYPYHFYHIIQYIHKGRFIRSENCYLINNITLLKVSHDGMCCEVTHLMLMKLGDLCCLIKLLSRSPACVTYSIFVVLSNFCRIIKLLPSSHPLLSTHFLDYLRTPRL